MNTIKPPSHYNTYQKNKIMTRTYKHLLPFAIFMLLSACQNELPETSSDPTESQHSGISIDQNQFNSSNFELGKIEQRSFSKILKTTGSIHIPQKSKAAVSTLMSGTIGAINLIKGQWVRKGQKLFTITNPELINLQEEYLVARGQLEYLNEEYKRQIALSKEDLSTKNTLLKAKSALTTTQARHGSLSKKLSLYGINTDNLSTSNLVSSLSVSAPISGYISDINAMQGMHIEPNQPALTLANTAQVYLELSVLEKDALLLKKDQKLTFTLQGDPLKKYDATVYLINKSINEEQIITVNCKINSNTKKLIPGMYANAKILLEDYKANVLPETALIKMNEKHYALVLNKKEDAAMVFNKITIETGEVQNGYIELKGPTSTTSEYLTKGAYFLIQ